MTTPRVAVVGARGVGDDPRDPPRQDGAGGLARPRCCGRSPDRGRPRERATPARDRLAGANPLTFAGLAGLGDVIATCGSTLSRNHRLWVELAKGRKWAELDQTLPGVAEGAYTVDAALGLARRHDIEMPIAQEVHNALFEGKSVQRCLIDLLARETEAELADDPAWAERLREDGG